MHRQCWLSGVHGCGVSSFGGVGDIGDIGLGVVVGLGLGGVVGVDVGGDGGGGLFQFARFSTGSKASGSTQKPRAGQGHCHIALFDAPFLKTMNIFF